MANLLSTTVTTTSGNGLTITTNDVSTLKMTSSGGGVKNWGFATTNLAASDFGIYQSNAGGGDPIGAGSPKLYFNGAGNVGIGTTSPATALHVIGEISVPSYIRLTDAGANNAFISESWGINLNGVTTHPVQVRGASFSVGYSLGAGTSYGTNNMFVAGSVGIGTTSPGAKLEVKPSGDGDIFIGRYSGGSAKLIYAYQSSADGFLELRTGGDTIVTKLSGYSGTPSYFLSNVGIGTSSPAYKLHVQGSNLMATFRNSDTAANQYTQLEFIAGSRDAYIWLGNQNSTAWAGDGGLNIYTGTGNMDFWTAATQKVRITSGGKVGIGTMAPGTKLDVVGGDLLAGTTYATLRATQDQTNYRGVVLGYDTSGQIGVIYAETPSTASNLAFWTYSGSGWGERMRIASSGNVGIGTTSPGDKLDVSGNVRFGTNGEAAWGNGLLTLNSGWGANLYPTIGSYGGTVGSLIMLHNPHIPFRTDNPASGSYTGRAGLRMAIDTAATTWWDAGLAGDFYHIYKSGAGEFLRITSAGNVGIGTTSPQDKLEIKSGYLRMYDPSSSTGAGYFLQWSSNNGGSNVTYAGIDAITTSAGVRTGDLRFSTSSAGAPTEKMRITSGGNVLINTTTDSGQKLQVNGEAALAINSGGIVVRSFDGDTGNIRPSVANGSVLISDDSGTLGRGVEFLNGGGIVIQSLNTFDPLSVQSNSSSVLLAKSSGNVGIGTTAPYGRLELNGSGQSWTTAPAIRMWDSFNSKGWLVGNVNNITQGDFYIRTLPSVDGNPGSGQQEFTIKHATGNVGIGTTSPGSKLDVHLSEGSYIRATNASSGVGAGNHWGFGLYEGTSLSAAFRIVRDGTGDQVSIGTANNQSFAFWQNNTERMRIAVGGNVGIGTTSPAKKLHVASGDNEGIFMQGTANGGHWFDFKSANSNLWSMGAQPGIMGWYNRTDSTYKMVIADAGNVGIGTTSPAKLLSVRSLDNAVTPFAGFYALNESQGVEIWYGGIQMGGSNGDVALSLASKGAENIVFKTNSSEKMRITSAGNVGIGTTAPAAKLEVTGGSDGDAMISMGSNSVSGILNAPANMYINADSDNNAAGGIIAFGFNRTGYSGGAEAMRLLESGNVGIGTTGPGAKLDVVSGDASVLILQNTENNFGANQQRIDFYGKWYHDLPNSMVRHGIIAGEHGDSSGYQRGNLKFYTNFDANLVDAMTIRYNGNVGIGTTAPGSKLSISGSNSGSIPLVDLVASGSGAFQRGVRMLNSGMVAGDSIMYSAGQRDNSKNMGQFYFYYAGDGSNSNRISMGLHSVDDVFNINGAGNVGIGTTAPGYKLSVAGNGNSWNVNPHSGGIDLYSTGNIAPHYQTSFDWYTGAPGAGTFRMGLTSAGNLGIGTTSPGEKLDVSGNARTSGYVLVNNHSDNTLGYRIANTSGTSISAMFTNSSNQLVIAAGAVDQINLNKKVLVNAVALGVNIAPSATAGRIDASNDIVAYSSSDERLKHNITPIANALDKVKSLTGVEFDWKPEHKEAHGHEGHDTGIIAQQVLGVMPTAVRTNDTGYLAVRYEKLIGLLIEGMKEQQSQIEELKAKLDGLTK